MQVQSSVAALSIAGVGSSGSGDGSVSESYREVVERLYAAEPYRTRDEVNDANSDLQAFKENLTSKGALRFFIEYNLEKIEKLVEEYRSKLEAYAEEHPNEEMDIESMVADYRKQLMEQFMNQDEEKAGLINPEQAISELLPEVLQQPEGTLQTLLQQQQSDDPNTVLI